AAAAVIEVLDAWYLGRDTFGQRPQDALRCVRADNAEHRQDSGQVQARSIGRQRDAHPYGPAAKVRVNRGTEHLAAPVRLVVEEPCRRPGPGGQDVPTAVGVGELARCVDGVRIDRKLASTGDRNLVAVRGHAEVRFL